MCFIFVDTSHFTYIKTSQTTINHSAKHTVFYIHNTNKNDENEFIRWTKTSCICSERKNSFAYDAEMTYPRAAILYIPLAYVSLKAYIFCKYYARLRHSVTSV